MLIGENTTLENHYKRIESAPVAVKGAAKLCTNTKPLGDNFVTEFCNISEPSQVANKLPV